MNTSDKEPSELDTADDAALNDYLRRDSAVSQRYREVVADAVPASLDHAVLAQAKSAVAEKKVSRWRGVTRWSAPLALAASVVVVVSIVRQPAMQEELVRTVAPVSAPATMPPPSEPLQYKSPPEAAAPGNAVTQSTTPSRANEAEQRPRKRVVQQAKQAPPAESMREEKAELDRSVRDEAIDNAQQLAAQSAPPPPAPVEVLTTAGRNLAYEAPMAGDGFTVTSQRRVDVPASPKAAAVAPAFNEDEPQSWLEHIRKLRSDGWTLRADAEWLRFRQKYPDFVVDEADTARPPK